MCNIQSTCGCRWDSLPTTNYLVTFLTQTGKVWGFRNPCFVAHVHQNTGSSDIFPSYELLLPFDSKQLNADLNVFAESDDRFKNMHKTQDSYI